jgi:hypothetical protein
MTRAALVTCLACIACGEASAPTPFEARLVDAAAWSGGEIALVSTGIRGTLPRVRLGADSVAVRRVDDSTVAALVPQDASGILPISVVHEPDSLPLGNVTLYGYTGTSPGPDLSGFVLPIPGAPTPQFYANGTTGLVRGDARFSTVVSFPDSVHDPYCQVGPGPSFDLSHLVVTLGNGVSCGQAIVRQVSPDLLPLDSIPGSPSQTRVIAEVAPGKWLKTFITYAATIDGTDTVPLIQYYDGVGMNEIHQIRLSPRGDRAAAVALENSIWVFSITPFDTTFAAPAIPHGRGAEFSQTGDTLYVIGVDGYDSSAHALLVAVDATSGMELKRVVLSQSPVALALDPVRPWIYVAEGQTCCTMSLEVLDRRSMSRVGLLAPPVSEQQGVLGEPIVLSSPGEPAVYVLRVGAFYPPAGATVSMRFAVKP